MSLWRRAGGLRFAGLAVLTAVLLRALQLVFVAALTNEDDRVVDRLLIWDGGWFLNIATEGYPDEYTYDDDGVPVGNGLAFFPLFPLLVRGVAALGVPVGDASLLVAGVAGLVAALLIYLLGVAIWSRPAGMMLMVLVCAQPMARGAEHGLHRVAVPGARGGNIARRISAPVVAGRAHRDRGRSDPPHRVRGRPGPGRPPPSCSGVSRSLRRFRPRWPLPPSPPAPPLIASAAAAAGVRQPRARPKAEPSPPVFRARPSRPAWRHRRPAAPHTMTMMMMTMTMMTSPPAPPRRPGWAGEPPPGSARGALKRGTGEWRVLGAPGRAAWPRPAA